MITLIHCLYRLPHLSLEEFQAHWLEHHALFARGVKALRSDIQYHTLANNPMARPAIGQAEPYDGFAVTCWDNLQALAADLKEGTVFWEAREDEKRFVDHRRSVTCVAQEHVIVEPQGACPYVLVECHRHRAGQNRAAFQESWLRIHGDFGRRIGATGLMSGYIQNHVVSCDEEEHLANALGIVQNTWDGIGMAYYDTIAQFKASMTLPDVIEEAFTAENHFTDHERLVSVLTRRHVIKSIVR